jgi:Electron transfer DM13/Bacterial Ig-like domain (group 2)
MQKSIYAFVAITAFLAAMTACVKTEIIPETLQPKLDITVASLTLTVGQKTQVTAQYTDDQGKSRSELMQWRSSAPAIAAVSTSGEVTATRQGQAWIVASVPNVTADSVLVTVITDPNAIARVEVSATTSTLAVGSTLQLSAKAYNASNQPLAQQPAIVWESSATDVVSVNAAGLATGLRAGTAGITAFAGGLKSVPLTIQVTAPTENRARQGTFSGNMGYSVAGTATLRQNGNTLTLSFGTDFRTSSGPGLSIYLAKNASGALNSQNSVNLGTLKGTSGAQEYSVPANVKITDFDYAVVYCVPFNVRFGTAALSN